MAYPRIRNVSASAQRTVYPDREPGNLNAPSGLVGFPFYSPFGFNGRYVYGRVSVNF